ncbi:uncharacterized protein IL334_000607 [Kwoniella shivajii]|uniref:Sm domain-containing protein n=1 Tax=Kwoniella shivajii TaxID=564305 RepID=A0ABZ1CPL1_9TREE|nr:hypothetical protein IL334_000607 [Kwoniella shivajii]
MSTPSSPVNTTSVHPNANPISPPNQAAKNNSTAKPSFTPSSSFLESLLGQTLSLTLTDRRVIVGHLLCVDKGENIILKNAEEFKSILPANFDTLSQEEKSEWEKVKKNREDYWPRSEPFNGWNSGWGGRSIGMIGVKGSDVTKIEVEKEVLECLGSRVEKENRGLKNGGFI